MNYGFTSYPWFLDTNIRPGYLWECDDDYPIIGALDAPDFIPAGSCHRFTLSAPQYAGREFTGQRGFNRGWDYV